MNFEFEGDEALDHSYMQLEDSEGRTILKQDADGYNIVWENARAALTEGCLYGKNATCTADQCELPRRNRRHVFGIRMYEKSTDARRKLALVTESAQLVC